MITTQTVHDPGGAANRALVRCDWPGLADPVYAAYHDREWGVPKTDDIALFEKLVLETFQSGLSWLTILKKREAFRIAFDGFDPEKIARYRSDKIAQLIINREIVRNQAKIAATVQNARAYLEISKHQPFAKFIWQFAPAPGLAPAAASRADVPTETPGSRALSAALKAAGFRFLGPTTAYAFMQSVGMVNDHLASCHRHAVCASLQSSLVRP
ncbi:MAG: DNA-3-methyladenine glycosylase I [Hyphomicrobiaceae bacterium]